MKVKQGTQKETTCPDEHTHRDSMDEAADELDMSFNKLSLYNHLLYTDRSTIGRAML